MFDPRYTITAATAKALMSIESSRRALADLPLDVAVLAGLRQSARLQSTHFSTQIEGNRLTQEEVVRAVSGGVVLGRERDVVEVRCLYAAIAWSEAFADSAVRLTVECVQRLHGLIMTGKEAPTPFRDGQNVIRNSGTGTIVYLPPEAPEVPRLMTELVDWTNAALAAGELPPPVVAAIVHCQFAAIHPYYDGNGRTARLLTNIVLHRAGYGLKGLYSLEEYYARNLGGYYRALTIGPSHNYHFGRAEAEITGFVEYFCVGMADAVQRVQTHAEQALLESATDQSTVLRELDPRARRLLELFNDRGAATTAEIAAHLGLRPRTVSGLCRSWVDGGLLEVADPSKKRRAYRLAPRFERLARRGWSR